MLSLQNPDAFSNPLSEKPNIYYGSDGMEVWLKQEPGSPENRNYEDERKCSSSEMDSERNETHPQENVEERQETNERNIYTCQLCGYTTGWSQSFNYHMAYHAASDASTVWIKNESIPDPNSENVEPENAQPELAWGENHCEENGGASEQEPGKRKKYVCQFCDYTTEWSGSFNYHMAYHTGERLYRCTECNYRTPSFFHFKDHYFARHTGHKPYKCNFCDYRSVTISNLKRHVMTKHTLEKPHACPHCDYAAVQGRHLKYHIKSKHTPKTAPVGCPHCSYKTRHAGHMQRHLAAHQARPKSKPCPKCDYTTPYTSALKKHLINKHGGHKPWKCPVCPHRAAVKPDLKRHIGFKHPELDEEEIGEEEEEEEIPEDEENSEHSQIEEETEKTEN